MALSRRTRFEVFKRDEFTCRYCGRTSPAVVLEIDHIVPRSEGGDDDPINLTTSCYECNRGKSDIPLNEVITGEDPHDRAILLLETERQLKEYNQVLAADRQRRADEAQELLNWWCEQSDNTGVPRNQFMWLTNELTRTPGEMIRSAMEIAISRFATKDWRYVMVVIRNWRDDGKLEQIRRA